MLGESKMQGGILVVGPSWIGDMVMAQTLFTVLREQHPDVEIDVIAPPATLPLVSRMREVNRGIRFEMFHGQLGLGKRRALGRALRKNRYRQAIILSNSWKSAFLPIHAGIPRRTGFRGEYRYFLLNDIRLLNKSLMPRLIDRFASLGVENGQTPPELKYPQLIVDESNQQRLLEKFSLGMHRPTLGICPGAEFGDSKKWPERHYAELADNAIKMGMQVWIFGGPKDQTTTRQIRSLVSPVNSEHCTDLAGKTSLLDVIDLLDLCRLVVSNDSGLMHVAAAVGSATAVIYGSTSPTFTPPLTEKLEILSLDLSCSPCFKRTCPLKHKNCLNELLPERLIPVIEKHSLAS